MYRYSEMKINYKYILNVDGSHKYIIKKKSHTQNMN